MLQQRMTQLRDEKDRAVVLLAIGATNTDSALDALLRMDMAGKNTAVEAALKEHRSPRAREAIAKKK